MKKIFFIILTIISIGSYILSGFLLKAHFTDEKIGMVMVFLIPLLIIGLISGVVAYFLKRSKILELNQFLVRLHYFNLLLIFLGMIALIYVSTK